jgi:hypothetical protein
MAVRNIIYGESARGRFSIIPEAFGRDARKPWQDNTRRIARIPIKEIADYFRRNLVVMGKGLRRLEGEIRQDKDLAGKIIWVEEALTKGMERKIVL